MTCRNLEAYTSNDGVLRTNENSRICKAILSGGSIKYWHRIMAHCHDTGPVRYGPLAQRKNSAVPGSNIGRKVHDSSRQLRIYVCIGICRLRLWYQIYNLTKPYESIGRFVPEHICSNHVGVGHCFREFTSAFYLSRFNCELQNSALSELRSCRNRYHYQILML